MKRGVMIVLSALALGVFAFAAYETARVFEARAETPDLVAAALAHSDPEIAKILPERIAMLLAVEDPTFWTNDGTDIFSPGAGTTTLTQGVAKGLYFPGGFHSGFEKIELVLIAKFALTPLANKHEILQIALTNDYLGHDSRGQVIGFAEGARRWFGRDLNALSTDQYLALMAMLYAPNAMDPVRHAHASAERVARIKRLLAKQCVPKGWRDVVLAGCAAPR